MNIKLSSHIDFTVIKLSKIIIYCQIGSTGNIVRKAKFTGLFVKSSELLCWIIS